ncbi:hypothetical protein F7725_011036 [Dissostichus mawsoni]|uniref:Uncharacterized protein n=1 Tax=Dissostichus mawsoni TaxID=36200 RepID=A0A7J5Z7U3_DISMA|nr:hypothetical protein F7725_011036 [Dissostichus mawsoni]
MFPFPQKPDSVHGPRLGSVRPPLPASRQTRSGRRKTHTFKKTLNPVYDQTYEFSVSLVELHRRTLDVAVKNGGGLLSKHKGLLGKRELEGSRQNIQQRIQDREKEVKLLQQEVEAVNGSADKAVEDSEKINLIAFTDHGSDPYVRLYLLPDKRRSGRRKTHTFKKTLNPVYDQTYEFSVSLVELHRRTLDVAVKNGGGLLSKHKGLLGKVHYPDVERVEWLNKTVKQMWPFISQFVDKLFRETIEPAVKAANPHLSSFCFTKIDMGDKPLRVNGVKVYTENVDKRQVIMDLQISFVGNTEIDVDIKKYYCRAGIKSIQDVIYSFLVLPNRITIPLVGEAQLAQLRFPIPQALMYEHAGPNMLEIELFDEDTDKDDFLGSLMIDVAELQKEQKALTSIKADRNHANDGLSSALLVVFLDSARNLPSGKKVTSDPNPFVQFRVGHKSYDSKTRYKTNEPVWEEAFTFLIHNPRSQELEVKDEKHECTLGVLTVPLTRLLEAEEMTLNEQQVNKNKKTNPQPAASSSDSPVPPSSTFDIPRSASVSTQDVLNRRKEANDPYRSVGSTDLGQGGRGGGGFFKSYVIFPCFPSLRNLIAFTDHGSDPYVRLYLLPDKRRSGRRKTHTFKKTLNPVYDQTYEFSVSLVELHRRTLDVAVKNGGGLLSKHKGLLGKVLVDLTYEDTSKAEYFVFFFLSGIISRF